jgi:FtsZ-binding cell division protein ZapB
MSDEVMRRMSIELDERRDEIRSLRAKVEELERKNVGLCHAYGGALIEIHDLKKTVAQLQAELREKNGYV